MRVKAAVQHTRRRVQNQLQAVLCLVNITVLLRIPVQFLELALDGNALVLDLPVRVTALAVVENSKVDQKNGIVGRKVLMR